MKRNDGGATGFCVVMVIGAMISAGFCLYEAYVVFTAGELDNYGLVGVGVGIALISSSIWFDLWWGLTKSPFMFLDNRNVNDGGASAILSASGLGANIALYSGIAALYANIVQADWLSTSLIALVVGIMLILTPLWVWIGEVISYVLFFRRRWK